MHKRTVDVHTKEVVEKLLSLDEFGKLPEAARDLVELAAYLHDIGKGPKSRWAWNGGLQNVDADHPVRAMPMMVDVILENVNRTRPETVDVLLKMICYHDLVGEVLGKERDEKQLMDVPVNIVELDMLFVIGKADATSLSESWWDQGRAQALYERCKGGIMSRCGGTGQAK
jgi:hypothetical protein